MNISPTLQLFQPQKPDSGFTNVISCLVPPNYSEEIIKTIGQKGDGLSCKIEMNVLLSLPIKSQENGRPVFSYQASKIAEEGVKDLATMRSGFKGYLENLIAEAVSESKTEIQSNPPKP